MSRVLAIVAGFFLLPFPLHAQEVYFNYVEPARLTNGLVLIQKGNSTLVSIGGGLLPRAVSVATLTPEGPVVTRFRLPAAWWTSERPPLPNVYAAPASLVVALPEPNAILYVNGELLRTFGMVRPLESPPLPRDQTYPLHLRAAYKFSDRLMIEDKLLTIRADQAINVTFDGSRATSVPLPWDAPKPKALPPGNVK